MPGENDRPSGGAPRVIAHILGAAVLGLALAALAYFVFFVTPLASLNLVVWAVVAGVIGFVAPTRRLAILDSAIVGFSIVFSYSILGYQGSASLLSAIPVFALLAVAGALGMVAVAAIVHLIRSRVRRART